MPYVKWSILFLLVHNLFFNIGIYNSSYGYGGKVFYMYSQKEYMKRLVYILLTMEKQEPLLGGYWFIKVLLLSSVLVNVLYYIQNHFKLSKYFIVTVLLSGLFICLFYNFNFLLLGNCSTLILAAIYIVLGYNFSKLEERLRKFSIMALFLMFAILTIATLTYHRMSMFSSHFDIIIYLFVSSIGSLFLIGLSEQICKIPKCVYFFGWIGKHTMTIFTFHFLAFKIVSLLIIALYGINYSRLSQFPVITDIPSMWWGIYTLAGVFIPIICLLVFNKIKKNCFREINILLI